MITPSPNSLSSPLLITQLICTTHPHTHIFSTAPSAVGNSGRNPMARLTCFTTNLLPFSLFLPSLLLKSFSATTWFYPLTQLEIFIFHLKLSPAPSFLHSHADFSWHIVLTMSSPTLHICSGSLHPLHHSCKYATCNSHIILTLFSHTCILIQVCTCILEYTLIWVYTAHVYTHTYEYTLILSYKYENISFLSFLEKIFHFCDDLWPTCSIFKQ